MRMQNETNRSVNFTALHMVDLPVSKAGKVISEVTELVSKEAPDVFIGKCNPGMTIATGDKPFSAIDDKIKEIVSAVRDKFNISKEMKHDVVASDFYGYGKTRVNQKGNIELTIPSMRTGMPLCVEEYNPNTKELIGSRFCGL